MANKIIQQLGVELEVKRQILSHYANLDQKLFFLLFLDI